MLNRLFFGCLLILFCIKFGVFGFFCVFGYAYGMYECLYGCLDSNKSYDMSVKGHIVYLSNKNTGEK